MTSKTTNTFSPEVRARTVRMVLDNEGEHRRDLAPDERAVEKNRPHKRAFQIGRSRLLWRLD